MLHNLLLSTLLTAVQSPGGDVTVNYVDCGDKSVARPSMAIFDLLTGRFVRTNISVSNVADVYTFRFGVPQGYYKVDIGRALCSAGNVRVAPQSPASCLRVGYQWWRIVRMLMAAPRTMTRILRTGHILLLI
jgi:hypothetical protein